MSVGFAASTTLPPPDSG
jgi:quercetin dioxygenase-like cupin family protein